MHNPHNAIFEAFVALGHDALLDAVVEIDPNDPVLMPRHWTVHVQAKPGVSSTHPLHNVCLSLAVLRTGHPAVRVLGLTGHPWGTGMTHQLCDALTTALAD